LTDSFTTEKIDTDLPAKGVLYLVYFGHSMRSHHKQSFPLSSHRFDIRHLGAFSALASHRVIGHAATAIIGMFFPIFLYEFVGMNLQMYFLWFAIGVGMRIPLFPIGAKIFSKTGLNISLVVGTLMWAMYYGAAYVLEVAPGFYPSLVLFASFLALAICHAFYWSPYHIDFAKFSKKGKRGHQLGLLYATQRFISVIGPIAGGLIIAKYSYSAAFIVGIAIVLLSMIPFLYFPRTNVQYEFGFVETFQKVFAKKYRYLSLSMFAVGIETIVGYAIWPIFLFMIFNGDYLDVGIFSSVIVLVGMLLQVFMGNLTDKKRPKKLLAFGVDLYSMGWIVKAFVQSVGGVFAASTFHMFGSIMMRTPLDTMMYEKAADSGHYIDEFTTIREVSLTFGRVALLVAMFFLSQHFSLSVAFIIAGLSSLVITVFARVKVGEDFAKL